MSKIGFIWASLVEFLQGLCKAGSFTFFPACFCCLSKLGFGNFLSLWDAKLFVQRSGVFNRPGDEIMALGHGTS